MALKIPNLNLNDLVTGKLTLIALPNKITTPKTLRNHGAIDVLVLDPAAEKETKRYTNHVQRKYSRIPDIRKNNCNIAILHGRSSLALLQKRQFARFDHILIPVSASILGAILGLIRYGRKGILKIVGITAIRSTLKCKRYIVIKNNYIALDQCRQYGPSATTPLEIVKRLSRLNYTVLRSANLIESNKHRGDIDILVHNSDLDICKKKLNSEIGTYPIDLYTDTGQQGHGYKNATYLTLNLAHNLLKHSSLSKYGVRRPSAEWEYLSLCYHLLFHNKVKQNERTSNQLNHNSFTKPKYFEELVKLATKANHSTPISIDEIEETLINFKVMPSLDLIGFYSKKNTFLQQRYCNNRKVKAGLTTFFIRDFGGDVDPIAKVQDTLIKSFRILDQGPVNSKNHMQIIEGIRGGNWADNSAPNGIANPSYWFICWDPNPITPSRRTKRKHPLVDNERIRVKDQLRIDLSKIGAKGKRIIHSSDNTSEALDHLDKIKSLKTESIKKLVSGNNRTTPQSLPNAPPVQ